MISYFVSKCCSLGTFPLFHVKWATNSDPPSGAKNDSVTKKSDALLNDFSIAG